MSDANKIMGKYTDGQTTYQAPEKRLLEDYLAHEHAKGRGRVSRFRIVDTIGNSYGCSYAHLIDWIYSPDHSITLHTSSRIYALTGRNLNRIEELLMEERIKGLYVFDPQRHNSITDKNEPIIEQLEILEPKMPFEP